MVALAKDSLPADRWEGCTAAELCRAWGVPRVDLFARVGSTNDILRELGEAGAPEGAVVLAEEQVAGRGRVRRSWSSPPGLGLWLSLLVRGEPAEDLATLPIRVALAIAAALDRWADRAPVRIKWPNDLQIDGRKVGGILCEGAWEQTRLSYVVVGIGLNLLHAPGDFPEEIRDTATSLRAATERPISRFEVACEIVTSVRRAMATPSEFLDLGAAIGPRDALRGRRVTIVEPESGRLLLTGHALGIAADGALRVRTSDGESLVRSGTVRLDDPVP